ncbi:MAG: hypothetical protein L6R39_002735 [Caloplaca ligustica]|nr:MAG: hypothetical protein L6R39_002735 [Caloplaca ligustica]
MGATSTFVMDRLLNGEGVLEAVAELVKIEDLETLKVKFPCTCQTYRVGGGIVAGRFRPPTSETEFQSILKVLEPLKALNIQKSVMFIAARPCIGKGDDSRHLWWQTLNTQCQKPACRAFAARFRALKDFLPRHPAQVQATLSLKTEMGKLIPNTKETTPVFARTAGIRTKDVHIALIPYPFLPPSSPHHRESLLEYLDLQ